MSSTIGVQFQSAGESILPALWNDRQPFLNLHLISSSTPPASTDSYPYPWTEVSNPSYQPQAIPAESITVTSDSLGSYGVIGPTQWVFGPTSGPTIAVNGWWLDDRRTSTPTPLWGGPINPPYTVPSGGGMLTIDSITITLRDCVTSPPPPPPTVLMSDYFPRASTGTIDGSVTETGQFWEVISGDWCYDSRIQANDSCAPSAALNAAVAECGASNVAIQMDCVSGGISVGITVRAVDANNFLFIEADSFNNRLALSKIVAGVATLVGSTPHGISGGRHRLYLLLAGDHYQITLDGSVTLDLHDSTFQTATKHGLFSFNNHGSLVYSVTVFQN